MSSSPPSSLLPFYSSATLDKGLVMEPPFYSRPDSSLVAAECRPLEPRRGILAADRGAATGSRKDGAAGKDHAAYVVRRQDLFAPAGRITSASVGRGPPAPKSYTKDRGGAANQEQPADEERGGGPRSDSADQTRATTASTSNERRPLERGAPGAGQTDGTSNEEHQRKQSSEGLGPRGRVPRGNEEQV